MNLAIVDSRYSSIQQNFDSPFGQLLLSVAAQLFAKFRKNHLAGMYEHNSQHAFSKGGVVSDGFAKKIIDASDCLDASETAARHDESEQRATHISRTLGACFHQMCDEAITQVNRIP